MRIEVRTSGGRTVKKVLLAVAGWLPSATLCDLMRETRSKTISEDEEACC